MNKFIKYTRKANNIVEKLRNRLINNPNSMCENYGQKEIRPLIDELNTIPSGLSYSECCSIKQILYTVKDLS